ncbi:filamentous hemagglutinin N-terminal domain-containing protein [Necropsobacter rosorum]|uniref:two-partner secretion domain-containing protein n=1 Tax=Necropsobacter rosorum TaxID=908285 RepID=UPI000509B495
MKKLHVISLAMASYIAQLHAAGLPQNGQITSGQAQIATQADNMTIRQQSPQVSIDWQSFDIGQKNQVEFKQPSSTAIAYNRVRGANASEIQGKLVANGRVFLANPNGVLFSKDAQVNVGSLLVTTKALENPAQNLNNQTMTFVRVKQKEGAIKNQGKITAQGENGFVALIGDQVSNEGTIEGKYYQQTTKTKTMVCSNDYGAIYSTITSEQACRDFANDWWEGSPSARWREKESVKTVVSPGQVILGSGENFTLTLNDSNIDLDLDANTVAALVENRGMIISEDGHVVLTAQGRNDALKSAVNNDGIIEAKRAALTDSGSITLLAENIQLGKHSRLNSETLNLKAPQHRLHIQSAEGAKITARKTVIGENNDRIGQKTVKHLRIEGRFSRDDSNEFYDKAKNKLNSLIEIKALDKIMIADSLSPSSEHSFIQTDALASMLASSGKVALLNAGSGYDAVKAGIDISGKLHVDSFRNTDSFLLLDSPHQISIHHADWRAKNGRLLLLGQLWNYYQGRVPQGLTPAIRISHSRFDLGNGSLGFGHNTQLQNRVYYEQSAQYVEEDQRNYFAVNLQDVSFNRVDDVVISGGFGQVEFDRVNAEGRTSFYIHGGNQRKWGKDGAQTRWEYGLKDLEERILRSQPDHSQRRWAYSTKTDESLNREFWDYFYQWVKERSHLETDITIKNSDFNLHNGFMHLMAKHVRLENSNITLRFDQPLDSFGKAINKMGINAENTLMDNSHIRIIGADMKGVTPDSKSGAAAFHLVGNLTGKNRSTIFVRTHQGYSFRTDGRSTIKGENSKDDLAITVINTGLPPVADGADLGRNNNDDYLGTAGIVIGGESGDRTLFENVKVQAIAPNGANAYLSAKALPLETKNADFSYFELPRSTNQLSAYIQGEHTRLNLSAREKLQLLDRLQGIAGSNLSSHQVAQTAQNQLAQRRPAVIRDNLAEDSVAMTICDEQGQCEERLIGKGGSARITVGELQ